MIITFSDGEKIGVYKDGKKSVYESEYIQKYRENSLRSAKNKEWKKKTDLMIEDGYYFDSFDETEVRATIRYVSATEEEDKYMYIFSVNEYSGMYYKYTNDENLTEAHYLSSGEYEFQSVYKDASGRSLGSIQTDSVRANIAEFFENGDFNFITDGDSYDENPFLRKDGIILFDSYPIGRDANNNFVTYLPAEICALNTQTMQIDEWIVDREYSYIKPIEDSEGNLYCIKKPGREKEEGNVFLEILLIPVRIVQAIVGFISAFVMCFAKKPMINGQSAREIGNGGVAKNGVDSKKMWVNNNLINIEKEMKRNKKYAELGFIPKNWTLVKLIRNERGNFEGCLEYVLAYGVADYDILEENGEKNIVYTNGKCVFKLTDLGTKGKKEPLFNTDYCVKLAIAHSTICKAT